MSLWAQAMLEAEPLASSCSSGARVRAAEECAEEAADLLTWRSAEKDGLRRHPVWIRAPEPESYESAAALSRSQRRSRDPPDSLARQRMLVDPHPPAGGGNAGIALRRTLYSATIVSDVDNYRER